MLLQGVGYLAGFQGGFLRAVQRQRPPHQGCRTCDSVTCLKDSQELDSAPPTVPGTDPLPVFRPPQATHDFGAPRGGEGPIKTDIEFPTHLTRRELRTDANRIWRNIRNVNYFLNPSVVVFADSYLTGLSISSTGVLF